MTEHQAPPRTAAAPEPREPPAGSGDRSALRDAMAGLRHRWKLIVMGIVLGALAGGLLRLASTPSYAATAKLLVDQQHAVDALLGTDVATTDPTRDLSTSVRLVVIDTVAARVRRELEIPGSTDDLLARVSAKLDGNTDIVDVTARDRDPGQAARIANQFARDYRELRARSASADLTEAAAAGRARLRLLGPDAEATAVGRDLAAEIRRLEILGALQTGGVRIVRPAHVPDARLGMSPVGATIVGALVGAVVATGLALLLTRIDPRLYTADDVERALGRDVLANVPRRAAGHSRPDAEGDGPPVDTYATLARVAFTHADSGSNVILVTSPDGGDGTAEVVLDLVRTMAAFGRFALAIDADLSAAHLTQLTGSGSDEGLAALLTGDATSERGEVVDVTPPAISRTAGAPYAWLLPAGSARSSSQALLGGTRMAAIVGQARTQADCVVIAGGALTERGSALPLAPIAGAAVLVVRRGRTREEDARRALRSLQVLEVKVLGVVLTDAARRGRRGGRGRRGRRSRGARRQAARDGAAAARLGAAEAPDPVLRAASAVPGPDSARRPTG